MVLEALNMTYDRDIHSQTGSPEPSMRHKIRTYETLALTIRPECTHYQQSHAYGPRKHASRLAEARDTKSQPHTDDTANVEVGTVAKSAPQFLHTAR
jgi:hypothetical protein